MAQGKTVILRNPSSSPSEAGPRSQTMQIIILASFCLALMFAGGASRFDALQIIVLRPLAALLLIPTVWLLTPGDLRRVTMMLSLFGLWLLWMMMQLIPLPSSIWQELPNRNILHDIDAIASFESVSRPISFTPFRGWNAAFSMLVPFCALLIAICFKLSSRHLLLMVAAIGAVDSGLGLLQVLTGTQSPLYFYAITNRGFPVGIFANENHSAVFSTLMLLVIARLFLTSVEAGDPWWLRISYIPISILISLSVLISGSRAGLVLFLFSLSCCGAMTVFERQGRPRQEGKKPQPKSLGIVTFFAIGIPIFLIGVFFAFERTPAFEDILARNSFEDSRWSLWPLLKDMMQTHWLVGAGFGSFDKVYQIYEPSDLLMRAYFNQAHNDWAQIVIEGGLPAIAILAAAMVWIAKVVYSIWSDGTEHRSRAVFWVGCFTIICAASVVDYPLRTPIFQSSMIWLLIVLTDDKSRGQ